MSAEGSAQGMVSRREGWDSPDGGTCPAAFRRPLIPPEWAPEIVEGMASPFADYVRAVVRRPHLDRDSCPFPVIVDRNVPDPEMVYVSLGYEVRRHYVLHHLKPVMKLEGV